MTTPAEPPLINNMDGRVKEWPKKARFTRAFIARHAVRDGVLLIDAMNGSASYRIGKGDEDPVQGDRLPGALLW